MGREPGPVGDPQNRGCFPNGDLSRRVFDWLKGSPKETNRFLGSSPEFEARVCKEHAHPQRRWRLGPLGHSGGLQRGRLEPK